jgi:hypothetical protein
MQGKNLELNRNGCWERHLFPGEKFRSKISTCSSVAFMGFHQPP